VPRFVSLEVRELASPPPCPCQVLIRYDSTYRGEGFLPVLTSGTQQSDPGILVNIYNNQGQPYPSSYSIPGKASLPAASLTCAEYGQLLMTFKDLARSLAVVHLETALRDQAAAEAALWDQAEVEAAGTALGRHCMGNAVGRDGQAPLLVPPGFARRATSGTVSYFYPLPRLRLYMTYQWIIGQCLP